MNWVMKRLTGCKRWSIATRRSWLDTGIRRFVPPGRNWLDPRIRRFIPPSRNWLDPGIRRFVPPGQDWLNPEMRRFIPPSQNRLIPTMVQRRLRGIQDFHFHWWEVTSHKQANRACISTLLPSNTNAAIDHDFTTSRVHPQSSVIATEEPWRAPGW